LILDELGRRECFYLCELLPRRYRKAHYNALSRAAVRLSELGRVDLSIYWTGARRLLCMRPGFKPPDRPDFGGYRIDGG
jgi:hypothetical protein